MEFHGRIILFVHNFKIDDVYQSIHMFLCQRYTLV